MCEFYMIFKQKILEIYENCPKNIFFPDVEGTVPVTPSPMSMTVNISQHISVVHKNVNWP